MFSQTSFCLLCLSVVFLNQAKSVPLVSKSMEQFGHKRNLADLIERYRNDLNQVLANHRYYSDDSDQTAVLTDKGQAKKKRMKAYQYPQSPYTIAFPALIRSRRWIDQQDEYDQ